MYTVGDMVLYGGTGVCRVADIAARGEPSADGERLFYVLEPLYQNCTIYTPVDATHVVMRPILSREEAERLIAGIPSVPAEVCRIRAVKELDDHYKTAIKTYDAADLLALTLSIHAKKREMEQKKHKFGSVDEKYMRLAEDVLFGELAAALGIPKEAVQESVARQVLEMKENEI
jgi:CarD family transcriptional regulator